MEKVEPTVLAQDPADGACEVRREYVSPAVEVLGTWQAVALANSAQDPFP